MSVQLHAAGIGSSWKMKRERQEREKGKDKTDEQDKLEELLKGKKKQSQLCAKP